MKVIARAKINLSLDVTGRRPDGYHLVRMVMQTVDVCDTLILEKKDTEGIELQCDAPGIPTDCGNLAWKAADLLMREFHLGSGVRIRLQKRIPSAAGLAGGSADAAAVLRGMNRLFALGLSEEGLCSRAVQLGADVPYCVMGGTALSEGIGEVLTKLPPLPDCYIVLAKPEDAVSTKQVYTDLDHLPAFHHPDVYGQVQAIRAGDLEGVVSRMENVLELVTVPDHPATASLIQMMKDCGAAGSMMSGSGPTVFGIFFREKDAGKAYSELEKSPLAKDVFLTRPCPDAGFVQEDTI
ncbi:MAG: 4-(cytidine 5'-diphospho)-2-C-methyl-D-erythritol kinase [Eubacterium sp.]|nr:4-(cytidine 5'-diphospho)-2-C-methyl-D-erythritol kinase [Eubacterium sp.]